GPGMVKFGNSTRGRRSVPRTEAPMVAVISASGVHHNAELLDLSRTGARLKGRSFPEEGDELTFKAEKVSAAGIVVWVDGDRCAVMDLSFFGSATRNLAIDRSHRRDRSRRPGACSA